MGIRLYLLDGPLAFLSGIRNPPCRGDLWPHFVGDFNGAFEPGNLLLTGPNLPHNWVSDVPEGVVVPLRCNVVQFSENVIPDAKELLPELSACNDLLNLSRRGVLFHPSAAALIAPC